MAKAIYVGVKIEETGTGVVNITADNVESVFAVTDGTYAFVGSGDTFTSNNAGVGGSTATTKLTALQDMDVSFDYSYSTEATYDKFTLVVAGTTVESAVSGSTTNKSYTGKLTAGQSIEFTFAKDSSVNGNDDVCTFSNMVVTIAAETGSLARKVESGYVGVNGVARKIKKAYIGVGGVAELCFSDE